MSAFDANFWRDRKVFITGHTGFKGAWLTLWLTELGARVTGFSLPPHTDPSLFALCARGRATDLYGDIADRCAGRARARPRRARHRHPHGRPGAGAPVLRGPARHLRHQRDGNREPAAGHARGAERACRNRGDERQGLRQRRRRPPVRRGRLPRRPRSLQQLQGRVPSSSPAHSASASSPMAAQSSRCARAT